jgi:hypothetical protein
MVALPPPYCPNSNGLVILVDCFVTGGGPSLLWQLISGAAVLPLLLGAQGGWGARGQGQKKSNFSGNALSPSCLLVAVPITSV